MAFLDDTTRYAAQGKLRTQSLFCDFPKPDNEKYPPVFTLKEFPVDGLPSFYQEFMKGSSEYDGAMRTIGSWTHWKYLRMRSWFSELVDAWVAEMELRDKAKAKRQLEQAAEEGNVSAQRTLYGNQDPAPKKKKTKAQLAAEKEQAEHSASIDEVFKESPLAKAH